MRALVRYIIWFVFDAIGVGARVRGPGFGSDTNLVPTSRAKPRDLRSTDEELTGWRYRVPKISWVSHFPPEERSFAMYKEANASGAGSAAAVPAPDALASSYTSELLSSGGKWENHEIFGTRYQLPVSSSSVDLRSRGLARDVGTRLVSLPTPGPRKRAPIPSASKTNQIIYLTSALICLLSFVQDVLCSNLCCPPAQQVLQLSH